jgi:hypothetical protein
MFPFLFFDIRQHQTRIIGKASCGAAVPCASNPNYRTGVQKRFLPFIDPTDRDFIVEMQRLSGLPE